MIQEHLRLSALRWKYTDNLGAVSWAVYQEALALEFVGRNIGFKREVCLPIQYKGRLLATAYCADFICFDSVVVELKALAHMSGTEEAQVINYLKATGYEVGLLLISADVACNIAEWF